SSTEIRMLGARTLTERQGRNAITAVLPIIIRNATETNRPRYQRLATPGSDGLGPPTSPQSPPCHARVRALKTKASVPQQVLSIASWWTAMAVPNTTETCAYRSQSAKLWTPEALATSAIPEAIRNIQRICRSMVKRIIRSRAGVDTFANQVRRGARQWHA